MGATNNTFFTHIMHTDKIDLKLADDTLQELWIYSHHNADSLVVSIKSNVKKDSPGNR